MPSDIALFALVHPKSPAAKQRILSLLQSASTTYYRHPKAQCKTWCYFTPSPSLSASPSPPTQRRDASSHPLIATGGDDDDDPDPNLLIAGLEVYATKAALSAQMADPAFKLFHDTMEREGLYGRAEELVVWYPTAGFVARGTEGKMGRAEPWGVGVVVAVERVVVRDREGRVAVVGILGSFSQWVSDNEPSVLTYSLLTRPKAPNEILLFVRYRDAQALADHASSSEFTAMSEQIKPYVANTFTSEFEEVDRSFVSNVVGGEKDGQASEPKL